MISELRAGTRAQRIVPVLLLTAADVVRDGGAIRADDTLSKPFNARELIARADMQMQLGKKRRLLEQRFEERTAELRVLTEGESSSATSTACINARIPCGHVPGGPKSRDSLLQPAVASHGKHHHGRGTDKGRGLEHHHDGQVLRTGHTKMAGICAQ